MDRAWRARKPESSRYRQARVQCPQAYSLNFAAVPQGPLGYLTAWPAEHSQPLVATLNALTGTVTANAAIVPAGANGAISVFVTDPTDLVIDINGYFAPLGAGGLSLYNLPPCRVKDTRQPADAPAFTGLLDVDVTTSGCGAARSAAATVFGVAVVPPRSLGYLTMWRVAASISPAAEPKLQPQPHANIYPSQQPPGR